MELFQARSFHLPLPNQLYLQKRRRKHAAIVLFSSSNLGELERFAGVDPGISSFDYQPPVSNYIPEPRFDGPVATVSIILLLLLTAIASDRILGLEKFVNEWLLKWKDRRAYERRNETIEAREKLEILFSDNENDDDEEKKDTR